MTCGRFWDPRPKWSSTASGSSAFRFSASLTNLPWSISPVFAAGASFLKNQLLFAQDDPAAEFYLVEYGKIKVFRETADGREQILHVVEYGQSFAEAAVLSMERFPAAAIALEDSAVIAVPREPFLRLLASENAVARAMLAGQAAWLRRLVDVTSQLTLRVRRRGWRATSLRWPIGIASPGATTRCWN